MTKIKICGITNIEDAGRAVSLGADAIGFVFADSPRKVTPQTVKPIVENFKGRILSVGVFVNESPDEVNRISEYCSLDAVQLHGDESPEFCSALKKLAIKAFRIKDKSSLVSMASYKGVFAYLLDTFSEKQYGGTGKVFDWNLAIKAKTFGRPIILSGGLGLDNVVEAIKAVTPYGVDISSSIEIRPGRKNHALMSKVVRLIKDLD